MYALGGWISRRIVTVLLFFAGVGAPALPPRSCCKPRITRRHRLRGWDISVMDRQPTQSSTPMPSKNSKQYSRTQLQACRSICRKLRAMTGFPGCCAAALLRRLRLRHLRHWPPLLGLLRHLLCPPPLAGLSLFILPVSSALVLATSASYFLIIPSKWNADYLYLSSFSGLSLVLSLGEAHTATASCILHSEKV